MRPHCIHIRSQRLALFHVVDTSSRQLDKPGYRFRVRVLDSLRLELLSSIGEPIKPEGRALDASKGALIPHFPGELINTGVIPAAAWVWLMPLSYFLGELGMTNRFARASPSVLAAAIGALLAVAAAGYIRARRHLARSPIQRRIARFEKRFLGENPAPQRCEPGPDRAVSLR